MKKLFFTSPQNIKGSFFVACLLHIIWLNDSVMQLEHWLIDYLNTGAMDTKY